MKQCYYHTLDLKMYKLMSLEITIFRTFKYEYEDIRTLGHNHRCDGQAEQLRSAKQRM
jgi:hypothetical protein